MLNGRPTNQPLRDWCQNNGIRSYWVNTVSPAQRRKLPASKSLGLVLSAAFSLHWGLAYKTILNDPRQRGGGFSPFFLRGRNAVDRLHEECQRLQDWPTPTTFLSKQRGKHIRLTGTAPFSRDAVGFVHLPAVSKAPLTSLRALNCGLKSTNNFEFDPFVAIIGSLLPNAVKDISFRLLV